MSALRPKPHVADLRVYEPGLPLDEVAREIGRGDALSLVKLASNENPLGPSPAATEAMRTAAARMHLYPDGGCHYLRQALAERLGVAPGNLVFGCGSNELIEFLGHVFLEPGTNIVMSQQAFIIYHLVAAAAGADTVFTPARGFAHDLDAMLGAIDHRTRCVFVANPNNPTGTVLEADAVRAFAAAVPDHVLLVLDEAYIELLPSGQRPELQLARDNILVLRTFSKAYGLAGLRIGYGIGPAPLIQWLEKFRQPFNVTAMAQEAALAALGDEAHVEAFRRLTADGLRQLGDGLAARGVPTVPSAANFLLAETGRSRETFERLKRRGVITRPMDGYGLPDHLRVSVGTADENQAFLDALSQEAPS